MWYDVIVFTKISRKDRERKREAEEGEKERDDCVSGKILNVAGAKLRSALGRVAALGRPGGRNPVWYLRFRCPIGSAAASFHQFLDAERQTYPHASPAERLLVSRACVICLALLSSVFPTGMVPLPFSVYLTRKLIFSYFLIQFVICLSLELKIIKNIIILTKK